jgi:hypothetical protein
MNAIYKNAAWRSSPILKTVTMAWTNIACGIGMVQVRLKEKSGYPPIKFL